MLNHLSAKELFQLGCTSRAMQQWILGTSAHLWQVSHPAAACQQVDFASGLSTEQR